PQDAVFYVALEWTGGPAGAPVLNLETDRPLEFKGGDIYLNDEAYDTVDAMVLEKGETSSSTIKIAANITIQPEKTGEILLPPIGGDGFPEFEHRDYTAVQINELYDVLAVNQWGDKPE
ncbi:hypothetical protein HOG48_03435, partial [Candidatus Peregrinibacteria bacterium]|nr:hypothetical protein [Candidatus Peregrinibacteria bacterium]